MVDFVVVVVVVDPDDDVFVVVIVVIVHLAVGGCEADLTSKAYEILVFVSSRTVVVVVESSRTDIFLVVPVA